jgi:hypothetical protein
MAPSSHLRHAFSFSYRPQRRLAEGEVHDGLSSGQNSAKAWRERLRIGSGPLSRCASWICLPRCRRGGCKQLLAGVFQLMLGTLSQYRHGMRCSQHHPSGLSRLSTACGRVPFVFYSSSSAGFNAQIRHPEPTLSRRSLAFVTFRPTVREKYGAVSLSSSREESMERRSSPDV